MIRTPKTPNLNVPLHTLVILRSNFFQFEESWNSIFLKAVQKMHTESPLEM